MTNNNSSVRIVYIIGNHPLVDNLIQQYKANDYEVYHHTMIDWDSQPSIHCDELFLLSDSYNESDTEADYTAIEQLSHIARFITNEGQRVICHLLIRNYKVYQKLLSSDFCEAIRHKLEIYPFVLDEVWSRTIRLDYEPITIESEKHAHLVIFGMNQMAEMVAIQSALVSHYPNFIQDHSKKTRITIIDKQACQKCKDFISHYQHLFDNSFYSIINLTKAETTFHKPQYDGVRSEFVDVEWEFIEASSDNTIVREKLQLWSMDNKQLLTIVMSYKDSNHNISEVSLLPDMVFLRNISIYIYTQHETSYDMYQNIIPFGMTNRGYDIKMPLVSMAKNVNYLYHLCYKENIKEWTGQLRTAVEINKGDRDALWGQLSISKRMSCIYHAMTVATKMRSIGLNEDDWEHFYDISKQDVELLSEVEHNRWSIDELVLGWRPCTDDEQRQVEADITLKNELKKHRIHYDLRAYHDLRPDETGKPVEIYDICLCSSLPLIAKAFIEER